MASRKRRGSRIKVVVIVATIALLIIALSPALRSRSCLSRTPVTQMVRAAASLSSRPIDGRLSGGFAYKPLAKSSAAAGLPNASHLAISLAATHLERSNVHELGVAFLLTGKYDAAVHALEEATGREPRNASVLNDLSVAYLARGNARHHVDDYAAALDSAECAWRLTRSSEAAWNRAVALQAFGLDTVAERAWKMFLGIEPDSDWRREAEQRRAAFQQPTPADEWRRVESRMAQWDGANESDVRDAIARFPAQTLIEIETVVLPRWARARVAGEETTAARQYKLATVMAGALAAAGERLPADTMASIARSCRGREEPCIAMARAYVLYAESLQSMESQNYGEVVHALSAAEDTFDRLGSSFALAVQFQLARCMIHENRFADANHASAVLEREVTGRGYRTLEAHVAWLRGLAMLYDARPEESIAYYSAARKMFVERRDAKHLGAVELRLADAFEYAGDRDSAMAHRIASFQTMRSCGDMSELYLALFEAGTSLAQRGSRYAADLLLSESVREAGANHSALAALALMRRSTLSSQRGDSAMAVGLARMAAFYSARTADPGQRALVAAKTSQFGASLSDVRDPEEQVTETIRFFQSTGNRLWIPQLLRQRALLRRQVGDLVAAEADFRQAVDIQEETLNNAAPAAMREGFSSDARANYEDLIRLLLDHGASHDALAFAERARLIGQRRPGKGDVLAPLARIGEGTTVVVYELQSDALTAWVMTRASIEVFRTRRAESIERRIASAVGGAPNDLQLGLLYDILIRDWIAKVPPESHVIIVPPPALADIPFAALLDRERHRAVVDDYAVTLAPSIASAAAEPASVSPADRLLIVGDPSYQRLPRLPRSRTEALAVSRQYTDARVLLDEQATVKNLLAAINDATVFHFAGHSAINELAPELSSLMLTGKDGEDARLYVRELPRAPLKLVVLAACSTAAGRSRGLRGTLNLARAFIDRGAGAVVGTLRPVPDDEANLFSIKFHEALLRNGNAADAVRSAQRFMKSRANGGLTWAAFCLMRGNGPREGGTPQ